MTIGIYKITNNLNDKSYIGASIDVERRLDHHKRGYTDIGKIIHEIGVDNFSFELIGECLLEELREKEEYYIHLFDSKENGMNKSFGGESPINTTGYYRVSKLKANRKIGYYFVYSFIQSSTGKQVFLSHMDIKILEKKVKMNGFIWKVIDKEKANKTLSDNKKDLSNIQYINTTGFYRVSKSKLGQYVYQYRIAGKQQNPICSVNIRILQQKVESKGLPWVILDDKKAKQTTLESDKNNENYVYQDFKNKTGFFRVSTKKTNTDHGITYTYNYYDDGKRKRISSVDLKKLKEKVKSKGLPWKVIDTKNAKLTMNENKKYLNDKFTYSNSTGFYRVSKDKNENYIYFYRDQQKPKRFSSKNIFDLKKKVQKMGLPWKIVDKIQANNTINQCLTEYSK